MSSTLAEKIMGRLAGRDVRAGEMVEIGPDWTFALDDGIGLIDQNFRRYGIERLAQPEKIALFFDHYAPADTPCMRTYSAWAGNCSRSSRCRASVSSMSAKASRTRSPRRVAWCVRGRW